MIKLKDILLEVETDVDKVFGKVAFPEHPEDLGFDKDPNIEPNTALEDKLIYLLGRWIKSSTRAKPISDLYRYRELFQKAKQKFPKIFKPKEPNGTTLYRGLSIDTGKYIHLPLLKKARKIPKSKLNYKYLYKFVMDEFEHDSVTDMIRYKSPVKYKPHQQLQSWTTDKNIALNFNDSYILETKQDDDFIFNADWFEEYFQTGFYEDETIHFGKTYKNEIYLLMDKDYLESMINPMYRTITRKKS